MKLNITVCNVDKKLGAPTTQWTIKAGGRTKTLDLCDTHAAPLRALMEDTEDDVPSTAAPVNVTGETRRRGGRRPRPQVVSLDQIEKKKAEHGDARRLS